MLTTRTGLYRLSTAALLIAITGATVALAQDIQQPDPDDPGLRPMIALRQALRADVQALQRIAEYQEGLLDLAEKDPEDALDARQSWQDCMEEINAATLCAALTSSYKRTE
ncbi:hypothetical protein [uncultured Ruegeria sp.]|uniref:hypothetical protein n=1 Tax=uncultured Ruegeria sp. TaxID=259304 RepID=UPI002614C317|nr:hypothetical protein [uncultured Ruegeria sp.]